MILRIGKRLYGVARTDPGEFGRAAVRLTKFADGAVYDVILTAEGLVECDCPSYEVTYRNTPETCKHGRAVRDAGLLDGRNEKIPLTVIDDSIIL